MLLDHDKAVRSMGIADKVAFMGMGTRKIMGSQNHSACCIVCCFSLGQK
jgi:hypothetical protein